MREYAKSRRLSVAALEYDDEEWQGMVEQWAAMIEASKQQGESPQIAVAKINAESKAKAEELRAQLLTTEGEATRKFQAELAQMKEQGAATTLQHKSQIETARNELQKLKIEIDRANVTDKLKNDLTKEVMAIDAQLRAAGIENPVPAPEIATPVAEPPGRAEPGFAYQQ
jgi:myosin heavy subunit